MAFSDETIMQAWMRCGGRCECQAITHDHSFYRCPRKLDIGSRGKKGNGAWEVRPVSPSGGDDQANCEVLCWDCHKETQNFNGKLKHIG